MKYRKIAAMEGPFPFRFRASVKIRVDAARDVDLATTMFWQFTHEREQFHRGGISLTGGHRTSQLRNYFFVHGHLNFFTSVLLPTRRTDSGNRLRASLTGSFRAQQFNFKFFDRL
jgi:hypothetical protein